MARPRGARLVVLPVFDRRWVQSYVEVLIDGLARAGATVVVSFVPTPHAVVGLEVGLVGRLGDTACRIRTVNGIGDARDRRRTGPRVPGLQLGPRRLVPFELGDIDRDRAAAVIVDALLASGWREGMRLAVMTHRYM